MSRSSFRLFSWNVNGLRACHRKGFLNWFRRARPDVLAVQEVRARPEQLDEEVRAPTGYDVQFHPAERNGYSGVALYSRSRKIPRSVILGGLDDERFNREGRLITADFERLVLINGYFPNGGHDLSRVPFKLEFSEAVLRRAEGLRHSGRSVVICGDINTAHEEIDLANPKANRRNTGFLPEERAWVTRLIDHGYVDIFRHLHPDEPEHYTWWSNRKGVRERNIGWRIDYFFVSPDLVDRVIAARIHPQVMGSDHCPIELELERESSAAPQHAIGSHGRVEYDDRGGGDDRAADDSLSSSRDPSKTGRIRGA
jgi:exodeoxyribonuclease-3